MSVLSPITRLPLLCAPNALISVYLAMTPNSAPDVSLPTLSKTDSALLVPRVAEPVTMPRLARSAQMATSRILKNPVFASSAHPAAPSALALKNVPIVQSSTS